MSRVRMLKKATLHPPYPRHAETCPLPGLFSARKNPQRTPERTLPGFSWAAAALADLFEHPVSF